MLIFKASSTLTFEKLEIYGLNAFLIADTLGWLRNLIIALKAGWEMHLIHKVSTSRIFKCFSTLEKNEPNILAFSPSVVVILPVCTNVIFSEDFTLS